MSRKFKLSKGQAKILERLSMGEVLGRVGGISPHFFWYKKIGEVCRIQHQTVGILITQGLMEDLEKPGWQWRGSHYRITPKGRDLLCQTVDTKA